MKPLKLNSSASSQTESWNLLGRLEVFKENASQVVLFLLVDLITLDQWWIVYHVAGTAHDIASIIQENVLSREVSPPSSSLVPHFSCAIFSLPPSFISPLPLRLSLSALCACTLRASCHCLSLFLTYDFIKYISVAQPQSSMWRCEQKWAVSHFIVLSVFNTVHICHMAGIPLLYRSKPLPMEFYLK